MGWCLSYIIGEIEIKHEMDLVEVVHWEYFFSCVIFSRNIFG